MLGFVNVSVRNGNATILPQLSWSLQPGETFALVGPSGSGKSLSLLLLLGVLKPSVGSVEVDGVGLRLLPSPVLQLYRQRLGVGFQEPRLLNHCTILENIMLPLQLRGVRDVDASAQAMTLLSRAGMEHLASSFPGDVPAGVQKMASLLRALIGQPSIVALDEPLEQLDEAQQRLLMQLLSEYKNPSRSLLIFTRDRLLAQELGAHVVELGSLGQATMQTAAAPQSMPARTPDEPGNNKVHITSVAS